VQKKLSNSVPFLFVLVLVPPADLKPENFVFDTPAEDAAMRLIDFGCAKVAGDDEVIADVAGSPYYCSPEVLSESAVRTGRVWRAADMWSVGVIVFLLVCGYPPFNGDSQEKIFKKIKRGKFRFPKSDAEGQGGVNLSESVKSLITDLLQMAPSDRLTAEAALRHPWVSGDAAPDAPLPSAVVDALGAFRSKMRLKKAVARVLAHHMTEDDKVGCESFILTTRSRNVMRMRCVLFSHCCLVASSLALVSLSLSFKVNLAAVFHKFDVNGDGSLGASEIANLMRHIKVDAPEHEIQALMESMDEDGDGGVDLDEFATHVTLGQLGKDKAQIKATFDMFDLDHDGFVTHKVRLCTIGRAAH
jgi:calcium-dependent protein kinase